MNPPVTKVDMPSPLVDKNSQSSTLLLIDPPSDKSRYGFTTCGQNFSEKYTLVDGPPKKPHTHKLFICNCELTIINE